MSRCIGVSREDKSSWERRAPITPEDTRALREEHGITVCVQLSTTRAFSGDEFRTVIQAADGASAKPSCGTADEKVCSDDFSRPTQPGAAKVATTNGAIFRTAGAIMSENLGALPGYLRGKGDAAARK